MTENSPNAQNLYEVYEDSPALVPAYSTVHIITHTPREFYITFGQHFPPQNKAKVVAKLILTEAHLQELYLNIGLQLKKFTSGKS